MLSRIIVASVVWLLLLSTVTPGQTLFSFEVASIRPSNLQDQRIATGISGGVRADGAQVRYSLVPLIAYIGYAYEVRNDRIIGPDWIRSEFFDIAAKLPEGATTKEVPQMLRALLADRFGLKVHREMRDFPIYALEIARDGLKMKESAGDGQAPDFMNPFEVTFKMERTSGSFSLGGGSWFATSDKGVEGKKISLPAFAYMLTPFFDRPVIDMTGVTGVYDFELKVSPEDLSAMGIRSAINAGVALPPQALRALDNASNDSLRDSMQKVGLTWTSRRAPLEVIVVDAMQKTPTEN